MSHTPSAQPARSALPQGSAGNPRRELLRAAVTPQTATLIRHAAGWFCERFLDPRPRATDQMVQAGSRGRQFSGCTGYFDCKGTWER